MATADIRHVIHRGTDTHHGYSRRQTRHTPGYWYSSWLQQTSDTSYTGVLILIMATADVRHVIHRGTDTHHGYSRRQTRHTSMYWYSSWLQQTSDTSYTGVLILIMATADVRHVIHRGTDTHHGYSRHQIRHTPGYWYSSWLQQTSDTSYTGVLILIMATADIRHVIHRGTDTHHGYSRRQTRHTPGYWYSSWLQQTSDTSYTGVLILIMATADVRHVIHRGTDTHHGYSRRQTRHTPGYWYSSWLQQTSDTSYTGVLILIMATADVRQVIHRGTDTRHGYSRRQTSHTPGYWYSSWLQQTSDKSYTGVLILIMATADIRHVIHRGTDTHHGYSRHQTRHTPGYWYSSWLQQTSDTSYTGVLILIMATADVRHVIHRGTDTHHGYSRHQTRHTPGYWYSSWLQQTSDTPYIGVLILIMATADIRHVIHRGTDTHHGYSRRQTHHTPGYWYSSWLQQTSDKSYTGVLILIMATADIRHVIHRGTDTHHGYSRHQTRHTPGYWYSSWLQQTSDTSYTGVLILIMATADVRHVIHRGTDTHHGYSRHQTRHTPGYWYSSWLQQTSDTSYTGVLILIMATADVRHVIHRGTDTHHGYSRRQTRHTPGYWYSSWLQQTSDTSYTGVLILIMATADIRHVIHRGTDTHHGYSRHQTRHTPGYWYSSWLQQTSDTSYTGVLILIMATADVRHVIHRGTDTHHGYSRRQTRHTPGYWYSSWLQQTSDTSYTGVLILVMATADVRHVIHRGTDTRHGYSRRQTRHTPGYWYSSWLQQTSDMSYTGVLILIMATADIRHVIHRGTDTHHGYSRHQTRHTPGYWYSSWLQQTPDTSYTGVLILIMATADVRHVIHRGTDTHHGYSRRQTRHTPGYWYSSWLQQTSDTSYTGVLILILATADVRHVIHRGTDTHHGYSRRQTSHTPGYWYSSWLQQTSDTSYTGVLILVMATADVRHVIHRGTDTHHGYSRRQTSHTPGYWYSSWLQQTSDTPYTGVLILIMATADVRHVIHRGTDTHHGYSRRQTRHTPGYWYSSWLQQTSDTSYTGVLILIMATADVRHVIHRGTDTHHGYSRRQTRHTPGYWYSSWLQQTSDTSYTGVLILIMATADARHVIHRGTDTHHGYSRRQTRHTPGYWYSSWLQQTSDTYTTLGTFKNTTLCHTCIRSYNIK